MSYGDRPTCKKWVFWQKVFDKKFFKNILLESVDTILQDFSVAEKIV